MHRLSCHAGVNRSRSLLGCWFRCLQDSSFIHGHWSIGKDIDFFKLIKRSFSVWRRQNKTRLLSHKLLAAVSFSRCLFISHSYPSLRLCSIRLSPKQLHASAGEPPRAWGGLSACAPPLVSEHVCLCMFANSRALCSSVSSLGYWWGKCVWGAPAFVELNVNTQILFPRFY